MMGTRVAVELWADSAEQGEAAIEAALFELSEVNRLMNPWDPDSELSKLNREAHRHPVPVSPALLEVITRALHYSRLSGGAFDISFASAGQYYDYRAGVAPGDKTLKQAVQNIDYTAIRLDPEAGTVAYAVEGLQVDQAIAARRSAGDKVSVVLGGNLGDRPRTIGIRHPRKKNDFVVMIPLEDTAISTSGDYERYFIAEDGTRVHHILDPVTGKSAGKVQSASVLASHAIDSDALSTTTFVLGVEKGLALINSLPGVDAIIIDDRGMLHYSRGLLREAPPR